MDNYERAFYDKYGDKNRSAIRSAIEFVLWVNELDPDDDTMAATLHKLPETEQQRLKNAVAHVKTLKGKQNNEQS